MRASEAFKLKNVAAGTYSVIPDGHGSDYLFGGDYFLDLVCTGSPTLALQVLGPDNAAWTEVFPTSNTVGYAGTPATIAAAGTYKYTLLPPGRYRIVIGTSTANYVSLTRAPLSE